MSLKRKIVAPPLLYDIESNTLYPEELQDPKRCRIDDEFDEETKNVTTYNPDLSSQYLDLHTEIKIEDTSIWGLPEDEELIKQEIPTSEPDYTNCSKVASEFDVKEGNEPTVTEGIRPTKKGSKQNTEKSYFSLVSLRTTTQQPSVHRLRRTLRNLR
ncbi:hypothetical protein B566_EDAN016723 [Ephemera danica]|nr:hypothetical protein B566_EDAN016723 [Ephemera danica]